MPRSIFISVILLLLAPLAFADEPTECQFCVYPVGSYGSLIFGIGWASDDSVKFADYNGTDTKGPFLEAGGIIRYQGEEGQFLDFYSSDLGRGTRQVQLRAGKHGKYTLYWNASQIPHYLLEGAQTPFVESRPGMLTLPTNWQTAPTTSGMSTLGDSLQDQDFITERRTIDVGAKVRLSSRWKFDINFEYGEKTGDRPFGGGVLTINSSQFAAPVDFNTNRMDMSLSWAGDTGHLKAGFAGSWFRNDVESISWENPFNPVGNTQYLRSALEPDNDFYQFSLAGAWRPLPQLRLSGSLALSEMEQDDAFLPYSTNPDFDDLVLPRASLHGRVDASTFKLGGKLNYRVSRRFDLVARIKLHERDNRTPVNLFTPVITDLFARPPIPNRPYSFDRDDYSIEGRYRGNGFRLRGGLRQVDIDRNLQSVDSTEERSLWAEAAWTGWEMAELRLRLENADRDSSPYEVIIDPGLPENPLMRKFHLAERERDRAVLDFDWFPSPNFSVNLSWQMADDRYDQSFIGLRSSDEQNLSVDATWAVSERVSAHAFVSLEEIDSEISGSGSINLPPWIAHARDRFNTLGAGLSAELSEQSHLEVSVSSADSTGEISTRNGATGTPFPDLTTNLLFLRASWSYRASDHWAWIFEAEHEKYDSKDWMFDGIGPAGISNILSLGVVSPDYDVTVLRVLANYNW